MDISSTRAVHLIADADFVSSPVAFRVHVASDVDRSDPCHFRIFWFSGLAVFVAVILNSEGICWRRGDDPFG